MTNKLELQNVVRYSPDANPDSVGYKYYGVTAKDPDLGVAARLTLNNSHYIRNALDSERDEKETANRTFDLKLDLLDEKTGATKRVCGMEGVKIDGTVQYDSENRAFAVTLDENQDSGRIDFLNTLIGNHLDLFA
ncbi:hypothetical protein [Wolbachia endosymbiont of Ctenocephalides felis wCfeT]|uniref:hypothetical protein n=1 Tax=Wolbachia endosymbiont of Ctenocephalides felis wCfeT TaxID=2732593 RepID=UPI001444FC87|nr:hypothetical protein [Wolbachia endosymbiont of Ctenocephalides felis wCfeT]